MPVEPAATSESKALWRDVTDETIGDTGEWTNKVELADINGDGLVDILMPNGGDYDTPGTPTSSYVFLNQGPGKPFLDASSDVFGDVKMLARVIRVRDVNGDDLPDILVGTTYQTQSQLFLADPAGRFTNSTESNLPELDASIGDLEFGDVDGDADLDVVLADWGPGSPMQGDGGRARLWLNDGNGRYSDATDSQMPDVLGAFSWDLELVDVDNDHDLDIVISFKRPPGGMLFENDGKGRFIDVSETRLPRRTDNYDFEAMDLNEDGFLDLVTVNDGQMFAERVLLNNGQGGFIDATAELWPPASNLGYDDNVVAFLDFDSDGDADFVVGSLDGPDRILVNGGGGRLSMLADAFSGLPTRGTLGLALADLNRDGRLDMVQAQGEEADKVFFGDAIPADSSPPVITLIRHVNPGQDGSAIEILARVHDRKSPTMPHDWRAVVVRWTSDSRSGETPMIWYGEYLWRAKIDAGAPLEYRICATDAAGNEGCSELQTVSVD